MTQGMYPTPAEEVAIQKHLPLADDICADDESNLPRTLAMKMARIEALEAMCRAAGYSDQQIAAGTPYVELMGS